MIELERTFLAKNIPKDLKNCKSKEIIDIYIPKDNRHPKLRLRMNGNKYELTKKQPVNEDDASNQEEQTIILSKDEFDALVKIKGKKVRKVRYYYKHENQTAEFDIFQDELKGLIVIDFEFKTIQDKNNFKIPEFCLVDITQEEFIAGGMICDKNYKDIEYQLNKYNYKKLFLD
jgi:CYTH domain-containing protein